jgi:mannose-6-phosphate isomerase-like protein (cupin superfamily)
MRGYITNIEEETVKNDYYRKVLFTAKHSQLVLMSLRPGEEIGEEVHELDQFIRFEAGEGTVVLDGESRRVVDGFAVVIPAGTRHNVVNSSSGKELKLYSIYSPPEHKHGTLHKTKKEADADPDHHFDGRTSL